MDPLVEGMPVRIISHARAIQHTYPSLARFWFRSRSPNRAWIVGWKSNKPTVYLVDSTKVFTDLGSNPPDMPPWTQHPPSFEWLRHG